MISNLMIPLVYKLYIYFPNKKILIRYINMKHRLPYHVVKLRTWPITSAIRAIFITLGLTSLIHFNSPTLLLLGRFSSSAVDVVETKRGIGDIASAQKGIKTGLSSGLFSTIVCCLPHVEILTNSVSPRHRAKCLIFCQVRRSTSSKRKKESAILF